MRAWKNRRKTDDDDDDDDLGIIDASVKQWRARLRACVAANGGQFEHKLPVEDH